MFDATSWLEEAAVAAAEAVHTEAIVEAPRDTDPGDESVETTTVFCSYCGIQTVLRSDANKRCPSCFRHPGD